MVKGHPMGSLLSSFTYVQITFYMLPTQTDIECNKHSMNCQQELFMIVLQIPDPMIHDLDLFFHNWHTLGKMVVLPHLARQFLQLCISDGLRFFHFAVHSADCGMAAPKYSRQCQPACDQRYNNFRQKPRLPSFRTFLHKSLFLYQMLYRFMQPATKKAVGLNSND